MTTDLLVPSDPDIIELSHAVEERFISVFEFHAQIRGIQLKEPLALTSDLMRWRQMVARHRRRDFRHTLSEKLSLRAIAQWTLDVNCEMRGQEKKVIEWKD